MTNIMQAMAPTPPAAPSANAPGRPAVRGHAPADRSLADRGTGRASDRATDRTTGAAGERGEGERSNTDRAGGERDFLTLLAALLPGADAGKRERTDDPQAAHGEITEALTELARLGEGDGDAAVSWPMPAMLARFIDPDAPSEATLTLVEAVAAIDEALVADGAQTPTAAATDAEVTTTATVAPATTTANAADADPNDPAPLAAPARAGTPGAPVDASATEGELADEHVTAGSAPGSVRGGEDPGAHGRATAAAARAEAAARNEAMSPVAAARLTDTRDAAADAPVAATSTSPATATTADGLEGLDGLRIAGAPSPTAAEPEVARAVPGRSFTSSAASVQRVLDAVELLENAPPPRQLTLELGDNRLRVSIEDGQVRLSLLGKDDTDATRLVAEARAALEERGFDLGGDRPGDGAGHDDPDRRDPALVGPPARRSGPRPAPAGLQL